MPEKEPQVTFTDRRKLSPDGEIRPEAAAQSAIEHGETARKDSARPEAAGAPLPTNGNAQASHSATAPAANLTGAEDRGTTPSANSDAQDETMPSGPTTQETAESNAAYQQTTKHLDDLLHAKSPESARLGPVNFEHLVQSLYMSAMMALGASTQPGEKPRIDLMGARQTIDLLGVLGEKTKGNLTDAEHRLLESALFELRMMFLEITNAIARNASNPGAKPTPPPKRK
jgi:hypothetical protein